jgi:hypothetical protein
MKELRLTMSSDIFLTQEPKQPKFIDIVKVTDPVDQQLTYKVYVSIGNHLVIYSLLQVDLVLN